MVKRYRHILSQIEQPFPEKFILQDIVDSLDPENAMRAKAEEQEKRAKESQP